MTPSTVYRLPWCGSAATLRAYFRSGWAFLIPYLAAYLLYWWLDWPVNPVAGDQYDSSQLSGDSPPSTVAWLPSLLTLYWTLHGIHLVLATIALHSWWRSSGRAPSTVGRPPATGHRAALPPPPTGHRPPSRGFAALLPWALLALLFYIPGIYLEWPSDPWGHLRRINEWHVHDTVAAHSTWTKSSYFLPYSLTGHRTGLIQLEWLTFYYTGMCLLLSWQYYRLARVVGIGERAAFVFVLLNALTFGNNIFSFHRYYGLSSSIFAQLGAVALTRIVLEYANGIGRSATRNEQQAEHGEPGIKSEEPAVPHAARPRLSLHSPPSRAATAAIALLLLIAFNHIQGIIIAALSIASISVWRLIEWRRSMIFWLGAAAIALSVAAVLWWPRAPLIDSYYLREGWLNGWYGFNLFDWPSPAADRAIQIIGAFGLVNLISGFILVSRNHVIGWLTVGPVVALGLPFIAIPMANAFAMRGLDQIVAYHRVLFAIPSGLAIIAFAQQLWRRSASQRSMCGSRARIRISPLHSGMAMLLMVLIFAALVPPGRSHFNRTWQFLTVTPDDLELKSLWDGISSYSKFVDPPPRARVRGTMASRFLAETLPGGQITGTPRHHALSGHSPADDLTYAAYFLADAAEKRSVTIISPTPLASYTSTSYAAACSSHWSAQEAVLITAGSSELRLLSADAGLHMHAVSGGVVFLPQSTNAQLRDFAHPTLNADVPAEFSFDARLLPELALRLAPRGVWLPARARPLLSVSAREPALSVYSQSQADFSLQPRGRSELLVRNEQPARASETSGELILRLEPGRRSSPNSAASWGVSISMRPAPATPPRLVIMLQDRSEIEGSWREDEAEQLQAWTAPDTESPPALAWLIWRPRGQSESLHIRTIKCGWIEFDDGRVALP